MDMRFGLVDVNREARKRVHDNAPRDTGRHDGVFASLDFFLFYIFWEAMLIPMYLIIGVWGGPRRVYRGD